MLGTHRSSSPFGLAASVPRGDACHGYRLASINFFSPEMVGILFLCHALCPLHSRAGISCCYAHRNRSSVLVLRDKSPDIVMYMICSITRQPSLILAEYSIICAARGGDTFFGGNVAVSRASSTKELSNFACPCVRSAYAWYPGGLACWACRTYRLLASNSYRTVPSCTIGY